MDHSPAGMSQAALGVNTAPGYQCMHKETRQALEREKTLGIFKQHNEGPLVYDKFQNQIPVFWNLKGYIFTRNEAFADYL